MAYYHRREAKEAKYLVMVKQSWIHTNRPEISRKASAQRDVESAIILTL